MKVAAVLVPSKPAAVRFSFRRAGGAAGVASPTHFCRIPPVRYLIVSSPLLGLIMCPCRGAGGPMRRTFAVACAAAGTLVLGGQALSDDVRLPRKGSSPGFEMPAYRAAARHQHRPNPNPNPSPSHGHDAGQSWEDDAFIYCWRRAKRAKIAQEDATQNVVVGYLAGGLIGAAITSSQNEEAYLDQKGKFRREAFDRCLASRRQRRDDD